MKYDILLFDADATLFDFNRAEYNALRICAEKHGIPFSDALYSEYHFINKRQWELFELGRITKQALTVERFRLLLSSCGSPVDPEAFNADYGLALGSQSILFPGALELCRELSEKGRIYIITNGLETTQNRRMSSSPLKEYILDMFVSETMGAQKPEKAYFEAVFSRIPDFDPSRALIIGDSLSSDIRGGAGVGVDTCWYNPSSQPNRRSIVPTYTARSYDEVRQIIEGTERSDDGIAGITGADAAERGRLRAISACRSGRFEGGDTVGERRSEGGVRKKPTHTSRRALVLIPAEERFREELQKAAPGFEFRFASPGDVSGELAQYAKTCEVVIGNAPLGAIGGEALRFVQLSTAGTEPYCSGLPSSVSLACATGAFDLAVSEHMLASLLTLMKKLHLYRDDMKSGPRRWTDLGQVTSLQGAELLIMGLGSIGEAFAEKAKALGAHVIGMRRSDKVRPSSADVLITAEQLDEVLPKADAVVMVLPATEQTKGLMSRERIFSMKRGAFIVNAGRGNAIDTEALTEALNTGHLGGAALDVTEPEPLPADHPLWDCTNALITPHVSGYYHLRHTYLTLTEIALYNLRRYMNGEPPCNEVDRSTGYALRGTLYADRKRSCVYH